MTHASPVTPFGLQARTQAIEPPRDLLEHLAPGGFAWLDGYTGFVTAGVAATVEPADAAAYLRALPHDRSSDVPVPAGPRAVGGLPFSGPGRLVVPRPRPDSRSHHRHRCTTRSRP